MKSNIKRKFYTYDCQLIPLTPIQIGSGEELFPYNYVVKNKKYYRIDINDVIDNFSDETKKEFLRILESKSESIDTVKIRTFINKNYNKGYGYLYQLEVDTEFLRKYESKISGSKSNEENNLSVKEFIGGNEGKYIPGSSIKGALRTAFLSSKMTLKQKYKLDRNKRVKTSPFVLMVSDSTPKKEGDTREARLLGLVKLEPKFDPFKQMTVTDTNCDRENFIVAEMKRIGEKKKGRKTEFPMGFSEVTKSKLGGDKEFSFNFQLTMKEPEILIDTWKELSKANRQGENEVPVIEKLVKIETEELIDALNNKAKKMIASDKVAFRAYDNREGEYACELLEKELEKLKENEALIRIGKGAGFNSTTFNLYNTCCLVHTRVVASKLPVGWAKIVFNEVK